ncbi:hypothetical protein JCGZ_25673 [Jatropha curcas]|uniref:Protein GAMETE EXPRESSED 3 n=1 Tax=Jatropha curcas TaxID=180498 RepID=A0A067JKG6_JATCU|nr:hypothetical protein JCGZ_25673 [Jatropha curcas]
MAVEERVLNISFLDDATTSPKADIFFGPEKGQEGGGEIIGLVVNTMSSFVLINIKNQGLFAYSMSGQLLWSVGPVISQFNYSIGCRKGIPDCYFTSVPVIDHCQASIYISNNVGEIYSVSLHSPHFNWIHDLSSFDKDFSLISGNNGLLYVILPIKALVLALDVSMGNLLWQKSVGPLSAAEGAAMVDSNGWISLGSLDGFLYSISPNGVVKKFSKESELNNVIQVSPFLDCSGYAVYICQTEMEGKVSQVIGEYNYISALKPKGVVFTLLVPATGAVYWSESYPDQFPLLLSQSDLQHFVLDEGILLAFIAASSNERTIMLFLVFESIVLVILAGLVRFCCIFWGKKKLQDQDLGDFLEKRRSLQLKKKAFDRTITELQQKAAEEAVANNVIEEMGDLIRERNVIERKLSTTYSLGRDGHGLQSKPILPVCDGKTRSYSFQSVKKESVTIFHTLSDTSSEESSSERDYKSKAKEPVQAEDSSSDDGDWVRDSPNSSGPVASSSKEVIELCDDGEEVQSTETSGRRSIWLKRRRALSSTD